MDRAERLKRLSPRLHGVGLSAIIFDTFDSGLDGWEGHNANTTVVGGEVRIDTTGAYSDMEKTVALTAGSYLLTFDVGEHTGPAFSCRVYNGPEPADGTLAFVSVSGAGAKSLVLNPASDNDYRIRIHSNGASVLTVDNIRIEVQ